MLSGRGDVRIPHVHRDGLDSGELLCAQRLPKAVQAGLAPSLGDEQHARAVEIVDDGEVAMALAEALLVDAQVGNRLCLATFEPTLHGAFQDAVNLVPAQRQQLGDALLAGLLQPGDRESFKQRGEAAGSLGPASRAASSPASGATVSISFDSGTVSGCMLGVPFKGFEAVSLLVSLF